MCGGLIKSSNCVKLANHVNLTKCVFTFPSSARPRRRSSSPPTTRTKRRSKSPAVKQLHISHRGSVKYTTEEHGNTNTTGRRRSSSVGHHPPARCYHSHCPFSFLLISYYRFSPRIRTPHTPLATCLLLSPGATTLIIIVTSLAYNRVSFLITSSLITPILLLHVLL